MGGVTVILNIEDTLAMYNTYSLSNLVNSQLTVNLDHWWIFANPVEVLSSWILRVPCHFGFLRSIERWKSNKTQIGQWNWIQWRLPLFLQYIQWKAHIPSPISFHIKQTKIDPTIFWYWWNWISDTFSISPPWFRSCILYRKVLELG